MTNEQFKQRILEKKANGLPVMFHHRALAGKKGRYSIKDAQTSLDSTYVDGIELDIQQTKDRHVVVRHDFALNYKGEYKWLRELTLAQVRTILTAQESPTLEEFLSRTKIGDKILGIELKQPNIFSQVYEILKKRKVVQNTVFISLYPEIVDEILNSKKDVACIYGFPRDRGKNLSNKKWLYPLILVYAKFYQIIIPYKPSIILKKGVHFYTVYHRLASRNLAKRLHNLGCFGGLGTVSLNGDITEGYCLKLMQTHINNGFDIIMTDFPHLVTMLKPRKKISKELT